MSRRRGRLDTVPFLRDYRSRIFFKFSNLQGGFFSDRMKEVIFLWDFAYSMTVALSLTILAVLMGMGMRGGIVYLSMMMSGMVV